MADTTKFVILGTQRTGTTLIRTCLDSHPDILCCGEVFNLGKNPYRNADGFWHYAHATLKTRLRAVFLTQQTTAEYLEDLFSSKDHSAIGFKFMLSHSVARPYILPMLTSHRTKAVLIIRRNALKTLISRRVAEASGVYHVSKTLPAGSAVKNWRGQKISLDTDSLVTDLDNIVQEISSWRSVVGNSLEMIEIVYEDYLADQENYNKTLQDFLDVERQHLSSDLKKVNPGQLSDLLMNYEDVSNTLSGTRYSEFLDK